MEIVMDLALYAVLFVLFSFGLRWTIRGAVICARSGHYADSQLVTGCTLLGITFTLLVVHFW
jgi:hypothetical protein